MLQAMRKHAKYFYFLFFIIILSFIFWGVAIDTPTAVTVAEVGNKRITIEEYWRAYENTRQIYREIFGEQFTPELEKKLNLREAVLNTLIDEKVLLITAQQLGIKITNKELQDAIMNDPRFMRDGVFRSDIYFRALQISRLTPQMFEESLRRQLTLQKMSRLIGSVIDLAPFELARMPDNEKEVSEVARVELLNKIDTALISFARSMRQNIKVTVNMELIS
jgi:peptidyl-prolyl cis-trans isomerase D